MVSFSIAIVSIARVGIAIVSRPRGVAIALNIALVSAWTWGGHGHGHRVVSSAPAHLPHSLCTYLLTGALSTLTDTYPLQLLCTYLLDSVSERVELRVEVHGPCAIDDPTVDVRAW